MEQEDIVRIVREFPDRSVQWLLETPENVRGLLLVIAKDIAERLDFTRLEQLRRTFIPESLRKREADLLFLAPFSRDDGGKGGEVLIYILIEHQSIPDAIIEFRVLYSMAQIWEGQRREWEEGKGPMCFSPILPVVFYTGSRKWEPVLDMKRLIDPPELLEGFVPQYETLFLNLKGSDPESLVEGNHPFGWALRVMQKEDADLGELEEALGAAIKHLAAMPDEERALWEKLMRFLVMLIYHRRSPEEHKELVDLIERSVEGGSRREEVEKMGKTIAESLIEEGKELGIQTGKELGIQEGKKLGIQEGKKLGIQEGKELGIQEGKELGKELGVVQTKQELLIKLLRGRFGDSAEAAIEKVRAVQDTGHLDALFDRALVAKSLEELAIEP